LPEGRALTVNEKTLRISAQIKNIATACDFVVAAAEKAGLDERNAHHCQLAVDEICTNIIEHGYGLADSERFIDVICQQFEDRFVVQILDDSFPFDPLDHTDPDPKMALEDRRIGGWGVYFIKKMMDEVKYDYSQGRNRLTMVKRFKSTTAEPLRKSLEPMPIRVAALPNNSWMIAPSGRLDIASSRRLEGVIVKELEAGHKNLILDMSQVDFIASGGLKILVSLWKRARDQKGDLILAGLTPSVREVFMLIGFDLVFTVFNSLHEAAANHRFSSK
jgi:anti-anti-sigma factor